MNARNGFIFSCGYDAKAVVKMDKSIKHNGRKRKREREKQYDAITDDDILSNIVLDSAPDASYFHLSFTKNENIYKRGRECERKREREGK